MSLLGHVLKRSINVNATDWLVLTSKRPVDNEIDFQARRLGFEVHRGSANDLVGRTLEGLRVHPVTHFIRINADSPWFEPTIVNDAIRRLSGQMTSNLVERRFPYGVSVEIVDSDFYKRKANVSKEHELEHVTQHIYRTRKYGELCSLTQARDDSKIRLTIDTLDDYRRMKQMFSQPGVHFDTSYWDALNLVRPSTSYEVV
jgi:spore coat polysaccharide biosynthesis protein SpsF